MFLFILCHIHQPLCHQVSPMIISEPHSRGKSNYAVPIHDLTRGKRIDAEGYYPTLARNELDQGRWGRREQ